MISTGAMNRFARWTLAPEVPGAIPLIEHLKANGILAAIGHTAASAEAIREAIRAGATLSTHLGNGAANLIPRHPNFIWEQLAADEMMASIIVDGHHLLDLAAPGIGDDQLSGVGERRVDDRVLDALLQ